jgi:hypothetical protein
MIGRRRGGRRLLLLRARGLRRRRLRSEARREAGKLSE